MALVVPLWETFESPHVCKHACTNTAYSDISFAQLMFVFWFKWDTRDCLDEYENEIQEEEAFMVNEVVNSIYLWLALTVAVWSLRDAVNVHACFNMTHINSPQCIENSMKVSSCLLPLLLHCAQIKQSNAMFNVHAMSSFTPFNDLSMCSQLLPNGSHDILSMPTWKLKQERLILCVSRYIEYPEYDNIQGTSCMTLRK